VGGEWQRYVLILVGVALILRSLTTYAVVVVLAALTGRVFIRVKGGCNLYADPGRRTPSLRVLTVNVT
jgi:hypothetical protein